MNLTALSLSASLLAPLGTAAAQRPPAPAEPISLERAPVAAMVVDLPAPEVPEVSGNRVRFLTDARFKGDLLALEQYRPGYRFWTHVFSLSDGVIAYGSATDGRLLATFPTRGDWTQGATWVDTGLAPLVAGHPLPKRLDDRRDAVSELLEPVTGSVVHNPTRGDFVRPNALRYGAFLEEWGRIYERFGVPADVGLAQALIESGFSGEVKSEARAIGFCQWLPQNWKRLDRLTTPVIEVENQTTQAAYCAAYLTVLATKYGSFIPALSEHHAGSTNVGRTVINGARLGGIDIRDRYLMGAQFAKDVRTLAPRQFSDIVGSYGPRSYLYGEMVFGNMETVAHIRDEHPQEAIYAMRASHDLSLDEIVRVSGVARGEVKRFNPALVRRVPRGATLYLPTQVDALGSDVAFWHRPAPDDYAEVLYDFVQLSVALEEWESPQFEAVLQGFRERFRATGVEEGDVMDAVLGYVIQELPLMGRRLEAFRTDPAIARLFEEGTRIRAAAGN